MWESRLTGLYFSMSFMSPFCVVLWSWLLICDHFLCRPLWSLRNLSLFLFCYSMQNLFSFLFPLRVAPKSGIYFFGFWNSVFAMISLCSPANSVSDPSFISLSYSKCSHALIFWVIMSHCFFNIIIKLFHFSILSTRCWCISIYHRNWIFSL